MAKRSYKSAFRSVARPSASARPRAVPLLCQCHWQAQGARAVATGVVLLLDHNHHVCAVDRDEVGNGRQPHVQHR